MKLAPPTDVRSGYIRLVKNVNYYIDSESIWVDNQEPQIVHFDAVVNLDKGLYVYPEPKRYARSVRQYKILNCANYHLTQVRTDFYDEFWGQGLRAAPKKQKKHTLSLTPDTTLYNAAQIICANYGEAFSVDKNKKICTLISLNFIQLLGAESIRFFCSYCYFTAGTFKSGSFGFSIGAKVLSLFASIIF